MLFLLLQHEVLAQYALSIINQSVIYHLMVPAPCETFLWSANCAPLYTHRAAHTHRLMINLSDRQQPQSLQHAAER